MEKYGGNYPLRVLGTDQTSSNVGLPNTGFSPTGNDAVGILSSNAQRLQGTAASLAQGAQQASQVSAGITENQIQANQAVVQTGQAQVQASSARAQTAGQFSGQMSSLLFDYWKEDNRKKASEAESQQRQKAAAEQDRREVIRLQMSIEDHEEKKRTGQLSELQKKYESDVAINEYASLFADSQGVIYNNGSQELKDRLKSLNERHRGSARPEFIVDWTDKILGQASTEQNRQLSAQHENVRQVNNLKRGETTNRFELNVFAIGEQMSAGNLSIEDGISAIDGSATKFIQDNQLDLFTSLEVRTRASQIMLKSGRLNAEQRAKVQAYSDRLSYAVAEVDKLKQEETLRSVPEEERQYRLLKIANETGVPVTDLTKLAPNFTQMLERNVQNQELVVKLDDLKQQQLVSEANKVQFSNFNVGDAVGKLIESQGANYESINTFLDNPTFKGIRFWEQVKATYKDWTTYQTFYTDSIKGVSKLREQQLEARIRVQKLLAGGEDPNTFLAQLKQTLVQSAQSLPENMRPFAEQAATRSLDVGNVVNLVSAIDQEYQTQIAAINEQVAIRRQGISQYGLDDVFPERKSAVSSLAKMRVRHREEINRYTQMIDNLPSSKAAQQQGGSASPFEQGGDSRLRPIKTGMGLTETIDGVRQSPIKSSTRLQPVTHKGVTFLSPFKPGTAVSISDEWGGPGSEVHSRRGRPHAGMDFAVQNGTPVVSPVGGVVAKVTTQIGSNGKGYGKYVDVRTPDGRLLRYAHLSGSFVVPGQQVEPGEVLGRSGESGAPGQPHLHFEVRDANKEYYFEGSTNPTQFLSLVKDGFTTPQPRRNNQVVNTYNPVDGMRTPPLDVPRIPTNGLALPFGGFIRDGLVHEPTPRSDIPGKFPSSDKSLGDLPFSSFIAKEEASSVYNRVNPIPQMSVPSSVYQSGDVDNNVKGNSFGYKKIASNPNWGSKLNDLADWLGVPPVWLADVLHFESGLDPGKVNQFGCAGIGQFCDVQRDEFGGLNKVVQAGFEGQVEMLKKYFDKWKLRGQITSMAELYTAFQRPAHVARLKKGDKSVLDQKDGNGKSIKYYIENYIGREVGRRYMVEQNRKNRAINTTHDKYVSGCSVCNQLLASNSSLVAHQLEDIA